jgi:Regulator of chromosome condensation (RCC1) repeat
MKTTPFKFDDLHNVQLSQDAAPSDGRPIQAPAGFGIWRMHPGHVRSVSRMKMAIPFALVLLLGSSLALHAATTVTQIAVVGVGNDSGYSLFLKSDGSLWGMGGNYGNTPEEIVSNNIVAVAAGDDYSLFVKSDGSLWGMGDNGDGELGDGTNVLVDVPVEIVSNDVVAVAAGGTSSPSEVSGLESYPPADSHSLFIKSDGSLWGMGFNGDGALGDGTTNDVNTPEEILSNGVVAVSAGYNYSLFLKSDGSLWGMGDNTFGELGNGPSRSLVPEKLAGGPWLRGTCFAGGTYRLLSSTNAALPVSQWTPVWTNTIVHRGPNNFSAPLPDDLLSRDPQRFYILQSQ